MCTLPLIHRKGVIAKHFKLNPQELAEFYENAKRGTSLSNPIANMQQDRVKNWKKKRKKGYKPRIFNEKEVG